MRTVESLIEELKKFPPDAKCRAYEGEIIGLIISVPGLPLGGAGIIHCDDLKVQRETKLLAPVKKDANETS